MHSMHLLLCALLGFLPAALAHNIQMGAHQRECFHEVLHKDDRMTVTFQVGDREFGGAGNLELDFWVGGPTYRERFFDACDFLHMKGSKRLRYQLL